MPDGLRPESLYYQAYFHLRQPLIDLMFEGVAWDKEAAASEREKLNGQKEQIKCQLDAITGPEHRLYPVYRHRSEVLVELLATQRRAKEAAKGLGRTEEGRAARANVKQIQSDIKAVRANGQDIRLETGEGLSGPAVAAYLYETLGLPAKRKRRKETGKITVTVDDTALHKLILSHGSTAVPNAPLGTTARDVIDLLRAHRRCEKLISTYLNPDKLLSPIDGRVHSVYKTHGTQSGRLSSGSDPWDYGANMQNQDREFKFLYVPK